MGKGWKHRACASMEVESIWGSPKPCPATTEWLTSPQGKQVALGAMPRVTRGACVGCSAAGIPEGECAGSSPSAWIKGVLLPGQLRT